MGSTWTKRGLWVFAIVANVYSLAWFGDLLHITDVRTKSDTVAGSAAVKSGQLYQYQSPGHDLLVHRARQVIEHFAESPEYAFLKQAEIDIIPEATKSEMTVRISHRVQTRYLRYLGIPTWKVQSDISIQMSFKETMTLPLV
ncbi:MAG: hypothetical protein V2I51_24040 [Anderseniella sp.]|jgi:hypothetical protein|nr:hypothetical protein [Anderseniella sp.]